MAKEINYKVLIFSTVAIAAIVFVSAVLIQSGLLRSYPKVEVTADNCYSETLRVITDKDYSPYSFYDKDGNISGYDIELITLVANSLHMNLDLRMLEWQEAIRSMSEGNADILMTCDYSDSFTGVEKFDKSSPTSSDIFAVYSKKRIKSVSQMFGKRIAIMEEGNVTPQVEKLGLLKYCTNYKDNRLVMKALIEDKADFAVMRQTVGTTLLEELGANGVDAYLSAGQSYMCWGIAGSDPEMVERINAALDELKQNGRYDELGDKWLTTFVKPYTLSEVVSRNLWISVLFFVLVASSIVIILRLSQKEYEARHRREMEYQEKLEAANKSKTDFLFNMSHDIRTPMNAIIGFTSIAKKSLDNRECVLESLDKIEYAGAHLLELINEVLDMSRVEAGKLRSEMKTVHVSQTASGLVNICQETADQRQVKLSFEDLGIVHQMVIADELHINQIIMNILGNAIKYTLPGGSVTYSAAEEKCDLPGYGKYVFTVQDTGIGMSKAFLDHIYDSFSREDNVVTREIQGTGLGMAIVKRLVDYLDGTIDIESEQGKGTKFTFSVHLKLADVGESAPVETPVRDVNANIAGKRILLVEDNELNREIASVLLEEKGAVVDQAVNGIDAVDHIKSNGPDYYDAVLMDIQMPLMDGYKATGEIRKIPGAGRIPIIALSANAFEEDRQKSIEMGMNEHVAKPLDIEVLLKTLAKFF